ncbi:hypothetical protein [Fundidesulfovibrio terrae]|uniref:hypothetical protein n=1 Tax=Fundidesulfovibrio terrae TaxID=2922866 RepID=UPI001FAFA1D0|nr:hypothetical protein [Fundidesulfovibrio terrae]
MKRALVALVSARRIAWVLAVVLGLVLAGQGAPALAAKKGKKKVQDTGDPIDVSGGKHPCYNLSHGRLFHRCEPQSLPYGRCRTGNSCCRGNYELSPISWYKCEDQNGHVTGKPTAVSILILGDNSNHRMSTGHVFVVEKVKDLGGGQWELALSHTNYDRRCSIETNVHARYDEHRRLLTMETGHWSGWGRNLKALGFILK